MKTLLTRWIVPVAAALALVAGCAQQQTRDTASEPPRTTEPDRPAQAPPAAAEPPRRTPSTPAPSAADESDRQFTGVQVCDEYLATYKACHSVIKSYPPEQLDDRLAQLRSTLQEKARDPAQRESLEATCQSLTKSMAEALNGRECEAEEGDFVQAED